MPDPVLPTMEFLKEVLRQQITIGGLRPDEMLLFVRELERLESAPVLSEFASLREKVRILEDGHRALLQALQRESQREGGFIGRSR